MAKPLMSLTTEDAGRLFLSLFDYVSGGTIPEFSGGLAVAFEFVRNTLDRDSASYAVRCKKNRQNALSRTQPNANNRDRMQSTATDSDIGSGIGNGTDSDILNNTTYRAGDPPRIYEVTKFFKDNGASNPYSEAMDFSDFNEKRNWDCLNKSGGWQEAADRWLKRV